MSNNELIKLLSDYKSVSALIKEAEKEKDNLAKTIKSVMGDQTELFIAEYSVTYKEVIKQIADTAKMKADGIYNNYSKQQVTRPLYVN